MDAEGEAREATVFEYHERDGVVRTRYEGGAVRLGFLVGTRRSDRLDFRYSQLNESGETSNGHCSTTISTLADGRLRLDEVWEWESKLGFWHKRDRGDRLSGEKAAMSSVDGEIRATACSSLHR